MKSLNHHTPLKSRLEMKFKVHRSGCWLWTGKISDKGYGVIQHKRKRIGAHRVSYEIYCGSIPVGLELDHLCRVRHCVNPKHLEPVTHAVNAARGDAGKHLSSRTHCFYGHEFNKANTYVRPDGIRACRACRRDSALRHYHRKRIK